MDHFLLLHVSFCSSHFLLGMLRFSKLFIFSVAFCAIYDLFRLATHIIERAWLWIYGVKFAPFYQENRHHGQLAKISGEAHIMRK
jgi:hypothetical protein